MSNKKGFNEYIIKGDFVSITLRNRKGQQEECIFSLEDLDKLISFGNSWHLFWSTKTKSFYAKCSPKVKGKKTTIYMHRFLLGADSNLYGDHKNHNTLDNRRGNIQVVDNVYNNINRKDKNSNNTSGYRNVSWINGYWRVQLQVNGKNKLFTEKFEDVHEAGKFAKDMRRKYYKIT